VRFELTIIVKPIVHIAEFTCPTALAAMQRELAETSRDVAALTVEQACTEDLLASLRGSRTRLAELQKRGGMLPPGLTKTEHDLEQTEARHAHTARALRQLRDLIAWLEKRIDERVNRMAPAGSEPPATLRTPGAAGAAPR
jgi:septal ring factor EnvC (AmiA/AmiB activator)